MTRDVLMHHFNTAGSGLNSQAVLDAVMGYLQDEAQLGAYEAELAHADTLEQQLYATAAQLVGGKPDDIALFDSATRAWITAVTNVPFAQGDRVWVTPYEYAGNILALQPAIKAYGLQVEVIPTDDKGDLDLDWMRRSLDRKVKLVSVVHIPSNCGIVNPVAEIGALLRDADPRPYYFIDACQSIGLLPINASAFGCDVLTGAGRKFICGPRGTALAYFSPRFRTEVPAQVSDLHVVDIKSLHQIHYRTESAKRYELLERANAAFIGLDVALRERFACGKDPFPIHKQLTETLSNHQSLSLVAPGRHHAGIVSFYHDTIPAEELVTKLRAVKINTWLVNGRHTPLYMNQIGVERAVRTSVHVHNTAEDIAALDRALAQILGKRST